MKRLLIVAALILALALILPACSGSSTTPADTSEPEATGEVYTMRMGCAAVMPAHPAKWIEEFKVAIEAKTSQIVVESYPASQLGSIVQMISGLQNNSVQGVVLPTSFFTPTVPELNLLDLPGVYGSLDSYYNMLNDKEATPLLVQAIESKGIVPAAYTYPQPKITIMQKEVKSIEDFKGMKIRTFDSAVNQAELTAIGAVPAIMATADVALALQQGTINGMQSDIIFVFGNKLFESAKYITKAPNYPMANGVYLSKPFMDDIPADLRALILETCQEVNETIMTPYIEEMMGKFYGLAEEGGAIVVEISDQMQAEYDELCQPVVDDFLADNPSMQSVYEQILTTIAKYE